MLKILERETIFQVPIWKFKYLISTLQAQYYLYNPFQKYSLPFKMDDINFSKFSNIKNLKIGDSP